MATDFRIDAHFFKHMKTLDLHDAFGDKGVLSLIRLWAWATQSSPEGTIRSTNVERIGTLAEYDGDRTAFGQALIDIGFVDKTEDGFVLHDWQIHNRHIRQRIDDAGNRIHPENWYAIKAAVYNRDGRKCQYCGTAKGPFHLDHVIPRSRGGFDTVENLVVACKTCNMEKGARTPDEWLSSEFFGLGPRELKALNALKKIAITHKPPLTMADWMNECVTQGMSRRTVYRAKKQLELVGKVKAEFAFVFLVDANDSTSNAQFCLEQNQAEPKQQKALLTLVKGGNQQ